MSRLSRQNSLHLHSNMLPTSSPCCLSASPFNCAIWKHLYWHQITPTHSMFWSKQSLSRPCLHFSFVPLRWRLQTAHSPRLRWAQRWMKIEWRLIKFSYSSVLLQTKIFYLHIKKHCFGALHHLVTASSILPCCCHLPKAKTPTFNTHTHTHTETLLKV